MLIRYEEIAKKILLVRGKKVMLDKDLAELYQAETKVLIQAVKRNKKRFPEDFMFQLNKKEFDSLRSHFVTSKKRGGRRYRPYVFTEQGVAMLSSVLNSQRAIMVNIVIMRTFVKLRKILVSHKVLLKKIENVEKKYDSQFRVIFEAIKQLMAEEEKPKRNIGFK
jgi:hypothetical protein